MFTHLKRYQGCFYPVLATLALLSVMVFLTAVINFDSVTLPKPTFTLLANYPDGISLQITTHLTQSAMKWLMLSYFYWLVGLATIGFALIQLYKAMAKCSIRQRGIASGLYLVTLLIVTIYLSYAVLVQRTPLMSFHFILENLTMIGDGLVNLATFNTALGYLALVAILVSISLLLAPDTHENNNTRRMHSITRIVYCGAAFLLIWVAQATEMYRLSANLLVESERSIVLDFAPTISLVVGAFASLFLAAAYLSAYVWLQTNFNLAAKIQDGDDFIVPDNSPKQFLLSHWPKLLAVLMPLLPGVMGSVASGVSHAM